MVHGIRWMSLNQIGVQIIRLVVQIAMARILEPRAFGLMTMALVVLAFLEIVRGFGTGMAVVQRQESDQNLLSSVFFLNLGLGLGLTGVLALVAPLLSLAYGDSALTPVLQVIGLSLFMLSAGDLQQWLLRRDLKFGAVAAANIIGTLFSAVCSITLGILGAGVWSLVVGNVAGYAVITLIVWFTSSWRPSIHFSFADIRQLLGFSANLSAFNIFNFFLLNGDKIIVGRFLGAGPLGFYGLAQRVLMYPVTSVLTALQEVMFAGLSRIKDDHPEVRRIYFRACAVSALICFPAMALLAVVANNLVHVVLGDKWGTLVGLIQILAPIGGIQSVSFSVGVIYQSQGRTDLLLRWGIFSGLLMLGSYFAGLPWGVNGVAAAYGIVILLLLSPGFAIPFRLIGARQSELVRTLWPYLWATLVMSALVAGVQYCVGRAGVLAVANLSLSVAVGAICYVGLMVLVRPPALQDLRRFAGAGRANAPTA
ncbi:lipopolysaccharide biosynthesis protein [Pseudofrankia sp. BMG5.36]|nr:lipopolysaccharide biosynthesis protein [Pseudofrankia sp. BMG5.36]